MKCKYEGCNEEVFEDDFCIMHIKLPDNEESKEFKRINELKQKKAQKMIDNNNFNFKGAILHISNINSKEEIYKKFEYQHSKELNKLIKNITKYVNDGNIIASKSRYYKEHKDLIFSYLLEKTNIEQQLNRMNASLESVTDYKKLKKLFSDLKSVEDDLLTMKLLEFLDKEIDELRKNKMDNYIFIFFINIEKYPSIGNLHYTERKGKEKQFFEYILKLFNLKRLDSIDYNIDDSNTENTLKDLINKFINYSNGETLKLEIEARDYIFAYDEANFIIDFFLGSLAFIKNFFTRPYSYGNANYSIFEIEPKYHIVLRNGKELINPDDFHLRVDLDVKLKNTIEQLNESKDLDICRNLPTYKSVYRIIEKCQQSKKDKNRLFFILKKSLSQYYSACLEEDLDYSFLKFWIISEYVIKQIVGKKNDDSIIRIMKKILSTHLKFSIEKFLEKRIRYLYNQRNKLVHEGKTGIISQEDRNLSKSIADSILIFYFNHLIEFKNVNEYNFYLQNIKENEKNLERYSQLLEKLQDNKKLRKVYSVINNIKQE
ncbi:MULTISPECIES: HEPN domain-containing protein [Methanobacterium]|uniref:HEPN domain-containing protein n=1 Tax=Methanobacterium veterum TaxID=408577 RepID=A0A9E5DH86_9EURY|nr:MULTISPECIES: HEPN domain-containing protein [Methanobacterium]MCZ3365441.1 HEPN domain-containing protein [Methanobacterium veterum]MCZ3373192.1 HEPN domain-containing protein [Methanobacterium veterum]